MSQQTPYEIFKQEIKAILTNSPPEEDWIKIRDLRWPDYFEEIIKDNDFVHYWFMCYTEVTADITVATIVKRKYN